MIKYFDYAIALNYAESMFEMGNYYYKCNDYILMKKYYNMAIQHGNRLAKYNMALYYYYCGNYNYMFKYLNGCDTHEASYLLGEYYLKKIKNRELAIYHYREAAKENNIYPLIALHNITGDIDYFKQIYTIDKNYIKPYYYMDYRILEKHIEHMKMIGLCEILTLILCNNREKTKSRLPVELWQYIIHPLFMSCFFK